MNSNQSKPLGRTLKLYLVDGTPSGVITAELGISTVKAVVASRTSLPDLIKRDEANRTGIYLLVGPEPNETGRQLVYVGEGDQVKTRLSNHDKDSDKDFFTRVAIVVSKDENLTKAHGRYLESRLIAGIKAAGRAKLTNGTGPDFKGLPESEIADMERVLDEIELLLPVLGFDVLQPAVAFTEYSDSDRAVQSPVFSYSGKGFDALAQEIGGEFVVKANSLVRARTTDTIPAGSHQRRLNAIEDGLLVRAEDGENWRTTKDIPFVSTSGAAAFVYGGSSSGRLSWKLKDTRTTYGEWRESELEKAYVEGSIAE